MMKSGFGVLKWICETSGALGAVLGAVVCLGLPAVSGALGVAGMTFLRNDRLLIPLEVVCCGAFLWTFKRGRQVHGKFVAMWFAFAAAGVLLGSMFLTAVLSKAAVVFALILLAVATRLNQVFLKRCFCMPERSRNATDR